LLSPRLDRSNSSTTGTNSTALHAKHVSVGFGGIAALDDVNLEVRAHEIVALIGPNGAGKTTLLNVLSGFQRQDAGTVTLNGIDVTGSSAGSLARRGVVRTFQTVKLFSSLSVLENVVIGGLGVGLGLRAARRRAGEIIEALRLDHRSDVAASALPHGEGRLVGIARALAANPEFLLLDEPAAGLDEGESAGLRESLLGIHRDFGVSLLVVEHDMALIMRLCDRIYVLDQGTNLAMGGPAEIGNDPAVREAYLGKAHGRAPS
jgi:ABC-type branched-subunit amino acid transport system ATPase component